MISYNYSRIYTEKYTTLYMTSYLIVLNGEAIQIVIATKSKQRILYHEHLGLTQEDILLLCKLLQAHNVH